MSIDSETLEQAQQIIGYRFRDQTHLVTALTHASSSDSRLRSNERLEFLGDAVLGMIVCEYLYLNYTDLLEGDLTKIKSAVVSRRTCSRIATEMRLDAILVLGKGMKTRQALPSSLSAAVLESVIGAIYLDAGIEAARGFLVPLIEPHVRSVARSGHQQNFKSVLQQYAQQQLESTPQYLLLDEKGPDHSKCFEVAVDIGGRRFESCWAQSKKQAEQQAALRALETLGLIELTDDGQPVYIGDQAIAAAAAPTANGEESVAAEPDALAEFADE